MAGEWVCLRRSFCAHIWQKIRIADRHWEWSRIVQIPTNQYAFPSPGANLLYPTPPNHLAPLRGPVPVLEPALHKSHERLEVHLVGGQHVEDDEKLCQVHQPDGVVERHQDAAGHAVAKRQVARKRHCLCR